MFRFNPKRCAGGVLLLAAIAGLATYASFRPPLAGQEAGREASPLPRPVVNTHELMELFNQPLYKELRGRLSEDKLDKQQWTALQHDASRLAEVANLIALRQEARKHADWEPLASRVQTAAIDLAKKAESQDRQASRTAFQQLVRHCNQCHEKMAPEHAPQLAALSDK